MSEKLVRCPFNPSHVMSETSLQRHVIRCMVNYPNFVACPYNALHRFKNNELLAKHMLGCDAKEKAFMFQEMGNSSMEGKKTDIHVPSNIRNFNLEEENWDYQY